MKILTGYAAPIQQQQRTQSSQTVNSNSDRTSAEAKLRELIEQKRSELTTFRPVEELGKHLDLRA